LYEFTNESEALTFFSSELRRIGDYFNAAFYAWLTDNKSLAENILIVSGIKVKKKNLLKPFHTELKRDIQSAASLSEKLGDSYKVLVLAAKLKSEGDNSWRKLIVKSKIMNPFIDIPDFLLDATLEVEMKNSVDRILREEGKLERSKEKFIEEFELEPETGRLHNS
jgi:hypothetical protein